MTGSRTDTDAQSGEATAIYGTSTAAQVFAIPELLENVFLQLHTELDGDVRSLFFLQRVNKSFHATISHSTRLQRCMYLQYTPIADNDECANTWSDDLEPMLWPGRHGLLPSVVEIPSGGFDIDLVVPYESCALGSNRVLSGSWTLDAGKSKKISGASSWRRMKLSKVHRKEAVSCRVTVFLYSRRADSDLEWYGTDWLLPSSVTADELADRIAVLARRTWDEHLQQLNPDSQSQVKALLERIAKEQATQRSCVMT